MDVRDAIRSESQSSTDNLSQVTDKKDDRLGLNDEMVQMEEVNDIEDDDDDDDEYEYYYEDENGNEIVVNNVPSSSSPKSLSFTISTPLQSKTPNNTFQSISNMSKNSNSLEDILADAKRLRQEQNQAVASGAMEDPDGLSIPRLLKGAISNIVTIDFFLVCGELLWFLSGIFCSYVLKDDTVQIAFNMQFERVVQPALGILMVGAAAGAVFKDPKMEEEEE